MYGSIFFNHRVVPHWNSLPATTCGQRTLSEQFQVAIGHVWARYGRQKPMSFLVHQQSSSSSSSSLSRLFMYNVYPVNFVTFVPGSLSRCECFGLLSPWVGVCSARGTEQLLTQPFCCLVFFAFVFLFTIRAVQAYNIIFVVFSGRAA